MKINWGTGIVIAFILFIAFILYFVVNMNANKKYDYDLVTDDYYKEELKYQESIDKEKNTKSLKSNIKLKQTEQGLIVIFPEDLDYELIDGKVFLYRPSNKQLDLKIPISLSNHYLLIPDDRLLDGRWNISVDWTYEEVEYLYKEEIVY